MYNFDLISDVHIDFWVKPELNDIELPKKIREFINKLLPSDGLAKVLVITGDLGHYNRQNYTFLKEMKNYYQHIIIVAGNHDFYLVSKKIEDKYKNNSRNRFEEMKKLAASIDNVYYLDGNTVTIDGITYGGATAWYDFSYGIKYFNKNIDQMIKIWKEEINDDNNIKGLGFDNQLTEFKNCKVQLDKVIVPSDVIITHVNPDDSKVPFQYKFDITTAFYYFDGSDYFDKISNKVWCFGHTHDRYDYDAYGCRFVNAALGYPHEKNKYWGIVNIFG